MLPILFQSKHFVLYSYPLMMGLAWGIGYQFFFHHIESNNQKRTQILFWGLFLSAWLGAKVLFLITTGHHLSSEYATTISFWMGGGFVFYGGLIGGSLFLLLFHLIWGLKAEWMKWIVISLTLGHGIGRLGCFLAGCCYGKKTDWWWGIYLHGHDRHPTQLIEALSLIVLALFLKKIEKSSWVFIFYCLSYGALRFVMELLRGDQLRGLWASWTPSQWISLVLVILGICLIGKEFTQKTK